jgi:hypothetical protein
MTRRSLIKSESAATAAEFALVLPLLLLLLFGIIDGGRFLWEVNKGQKATQAGARFAAVTNMVPSDLASYSFAVQGGITPGTPIPASAFDAVTCTSGGCTNGDSSDDCKMSASGTFAASPGFDSAAFTRVVDRMHALDHRIASNNVRIIYCNVGLGYAGNPYGSDVSPQVIVSLTGLSFVPITSLLFATLTLPSSSSSMPMEDGVGVQSN